MGVEGDGERLWRGEGRGTARAARVTGLSSGCMCTLTPRPHGPANLQARRKPLEGGGDVRGWDSISPCTHSTRYRLIPSAQPFPIAFHRLSSPQNGGKQKRWELHCSWSVFTFFFRHAHTSLLEWYLKLLEQALFSISNPSFIPVFILQFFLFSHSFSCEVMYSLRLVYFKLTVMA